MYLLFGGGRNACVNGIKCSSKHEFRTINRRWKRFHGCAEAQIFKSSYNLSEINTWMSDINVIMLNKKIAQIVLSRSFFHCRNDCRMNQFKSYGILQKSWKFFEHNKNNLIRRGMIRMNDLLFPTDKLTIQRHRTI